MFDHFEGLSEIPYTLPEILVATENRPGPNRKVVFQPSISRCYVSFRGCNTVDGKTPGLGCPQMLVVIPGFTRPFGTSQVVQDFLSSQP